MSCTENFGVLFVCTANLCRSQLAEVQLRQLLPDGVEVSSAGTHAVDGAQIPPQFRPLFDPYDVEFLTASRLSPEMLERADLVLTMTRSQRSDVVRILPRSVRHTFTLTQFVECAEQAVEGDAALGVAAKQPDGYRHLLKAVQGTRGTTRRGAAPVDIADSARARPRELHKIKAEVSRYVTRFAEVGQVRALAVEVPRHRSTVGQTADAT